jgi:hypothetical protein
MSSTITWASSGNGTKTGTAAANFFDDLDTLITSKSGDSTFKWQKAGKNSAATPFWLLLSRKDASVGRLLIVCWTSAPAGNNAAILDTAPSTNNIFIAWFPQGNANTASNLTASSGTIAGDDTGAVKCAPFSTIASAYGANFVPFYFDSTEGMVFGAGNPAATTSYIMGAGALLVDASDNAYDCTFGLASNASANLGSATSSPMPWSGTTPNAGSATAVVRTNYGATNRAYFMSWLPSGVWANQAIGSADILTDTSVSRAWFVPVQLLGQAKGEGFVLKWRQIGFGPGTTGPFSVYNTTGPVVAARQFCNATAGVTGAPWMVNFKI